MHFPTFATALRGSYFAYTVSFRPLTPNSKPLYKPLEQGRVELAREISNLACCLVHLEAECTPEFTPKHGYILLTTSSHVLQMLLEGPPGKEVTSVVHQAVMGSLRQCLKHHQSGLSASALSTAHSICVKGLMDDRRHVRLAAGYVPDATTSATDIYAVYSVMSPLSWLGCTKPMTTTKLRP